MEKYAAGLTLFVALTVAGAPAWGGTGSPWAGVWHKTTAAGVQVDCLDVGLNNSWITDFSGLTFTVSGPAGFSYQFLNSDLYTDATGVPEMYHEFATPLPAGLYTFSVSDGSGTVTRATDTHVTVAPLPVVDSGTIQYRRDAGGFYRFSWAPINDPRPVYYRLVLSRADGRELYYGSRSMATSQSVFAYDTFNNLYNPLTDGVGFKARVEVHDAPGFELVTNRSYSANLNFTPQPSDYHPEIAARVDYTAVYNRQESDGSWAVDFSLGFESSMTGVSAASVTGPEGFSYDFSLGADRDPVWPELYKKVPGHLPAGLYTFHLTVNGVEQSAYATLSDPVGYPAFDGSTGLAEDLGTGAVRFSWADLDRNGALYYRVFIEDAVTGAYYVSPRLNTSFADVGKGNFNNFLSPQWRVEVFDSSSITTQRNRRVGAFQPLVVQPFDPARPTIYPSISAVTDYDGQQSTDIYLESYPAASGLTLEGPQGYQRDLAPFGTGYLDFLEPVAPAPGRYRFQAVGPTGLSTTRYNWQPEPHPVAPVDFRTVNVTDEGGGWVSLSWAPVASDLPLWYGIEFYPVAPTGRTMGGPLPASSYYLTGTSTWFYAPSFAGTPVMFRIFAFDGKNGTTHNNYSRSVMVGYSGPGYDYASLQDADGDGYASNLDADDHDPAQNPFPYPAVTSFTLPAASASLTVPVTTFTTRGEIAGYCLSEINSSAGCLWQASPPAGYTFVTPGAKTLYAFVREASGNVSASASASTGITLNPTLTLEFSGSGAGSVSGGVSCSKGGACPAASFPGGTLVTLTAQAGGDSIFTGWSGDCAGSGASCSLTMNGSKGVTAGFTTMPAVWLTRGSAATDYFGALADAYAVAASGAVIKLKAGTFIENLTLARGVNVTLKGGYNAGYLGNTGSRSVLRGKLVLRSGSLTAQGLAVH